MHARPRKTYLFVSLLTAAMSAIFCYPAHAKKQSVTRTIQTIYGSFSVADPVIAQLIDSPIVQRMKAVDQYGLSDQKSFSRYVHSLGVWALLKKFGAPRYECIAGLLHDVSHTIFSHIGDKVFRHCCMKKSYQDSIHGWYLEQTTVPTILKRYGIPFDIVLVDKDRYPMLESDLPDICVDRIEYNLRGGLVEGIITQKDIDEILRAIKFENGVWFFTCADSARKFASIPLFLTEHVWGAHYLYVRQTFFAHALRKAVKIGLLSSHDIHYSTDDEAIEILKKSANPVIKKSLETTAHSDALYTLGDHYEFDTHVICKFRGVDPWVQQNDGTLKRLTDIDRIFAHYYNLVNDRMTQGWFIKFVDDTWYANRKYLEKVFAWNNTKR